jgi:hypothetical protein
MGAHQRLSLAGQFSRHPLVPLLGSEILKLRLKSKQRRAKTSSHLQTGLLVDSSRFKMRPLRTSIVSLPRYAKAADVF